MRLFISYVQADKVFRDHLVEQLKSLERNHILEMWDAHEILGGTEREPAIAEQLDAADIVLLLISAAYIASDRYDIEMQRAIERHENQEARVIPILLKPCDWESAPFADLEVLPKGGNPVTSGDTEAAFAAIAQEIRRVAIELNPALAKPKKSPMKLGAPLPGVRLPDNFVERPEALNAVKALLLEESEKPLVVSAIAGLGGLGKSVLAAALVLDGEVQARFEDGILWVTLGQNPDLQSLLGDWIRTLDKSRESYSATTLESASRYLQTLLIEKRMLLVVDDVWNGAHVEHFRVGGAACRMLVTTREAQIDGAEYHALDLMSEEQAIDLVRQKLQRQWKAEQEAEVKAFAKSLGYLPLALDLAANQVRDGFSWAELRSEFEAERRSVALEVLDSSEAWDCLDEAQQRKYSLRACFNLSLRRLSAEQLRQFAWLGVLPEDASLDVRMAMTLWALPKVQAKRALVVLKNRSFLTSGTQTLEGEATFRVHDLMHDTARGLLEQGALSDPLLSLQSPIRDSTVKLRNLISAHGQLLERYRQQAQGRWDRLPNDGYIHRHLTWHLQQAGMEDEIHALMAMSDERGRNAWFEACDRIGQPTIFVQDVKRAWSIAEQSYEEDSTRSIVLQCRYALITATLNTLVANLPIKVMAELVKRKYWTPEQAWAYVEQMQNEKKVMEAVEELVPYLPKFMFRIVIEKVRSIKDKSCRAEGLVALAKFDSIYFFEALEAVWLAHNAISMTVLERLKTNQDESGDARAILLTELAEIDSICFVEALEAVRSVEDKFDRVLLLSRLVQIDSIYFAEAVAAARSIQDQSKRAKALCHLTKIDSICFTEALEAARSIQDQSKRAEALFHLTQIDSIYFTEALEAARSIQDQSKRAEALCYLARIDDTCFVEALQEAQAVDNLQRRAYAIEILTELDNSTFSFIVYPMLDRDKYLEAYILSSLAKIDPKYIADALTFAHSLKDKFSCSIIFTTLAKIEPTYSEEALVALDLFSGEEKKIFDFQVEKLACILAKIDNVPITYLLNAVTSIHDEGSYARALLSLAQIDETYFIESLEAVPLIKNEFEYAEVLSDLARIDNSYCAEVLEAARSIQNVFHRVRVLSALAQINKTYSTEALETARSIQDEYQRAASLSTFVAKIDKSCFTEVLSEVRLLRNKVDRAYRLVDLASIDPTYFSKALDIVRSIRDEELRAEFLSDLAKIKNADFDELLVDAKKIQDENRRVDVLWQLVTRRSTYIAEELLEAVQLVQDVSKRSLLEAWLFFAPVFTFPSNATLALDLLLLSRNEQNVAEIWHNYEIPNELLPQFLEVILPILQDEQSFAEMLCSLAKLLSGECLPKVLGAIYTISQKLKRAKVLSTYLPRLPLATLSPTDWQSYLHLLAHRTRADLMQDLATLYPAIVHLGGKAAVRGTVDAMREVCQQWK